MHLVSNAKCKYIFVHKKTPYCTLPYAYFYDFILRLCGSLYCLCNILFGTFILKFGCLEYGLL